MIIQQRALEDLFCRDSKGKTAGGCRGGYWFSKGRMAPQGPSRDRPVNDDTSGRNKAITGGVGKALLKRQASCVDPAAPLQPSHSACDFPCLCSRADVLEKAVRIF